MAEILLKHPKHGYKICHSESEAAYDRAHGWQDHKLVAAPAVNVEPEMPAFLAPPPVEVPPPVVPPVKVPKPKKAEG